ncbi:MAG TPA: 16S rRNA (guanine(966)-N(2))-methyltransferase RsmD [Thermoanaerobaculia bacterium]|nr:16S rRNA (guanine(966)-N(2))-methyltransferase RsmD [Thermoanaerobaculia bacterium]
MKGRGSIRISAGRWKAKALEVPASARPTSARAREALFDLLGEELAGARFLDLYAGSGAVGIEAVSRGAARAVLVDRDSSVLEKNVDRLGFAPDVAVLRLAAADALRVLASRGDRFDVIFADPPYGDGPAVPYGLERILAPGGVIVVQLDEGGPAPEIEHLAATDERRYGRNRLAFYRRIAEAGGHSRTTR